MAAEALEARVRELLRQRSFRLAVEVALYGQGELPGYGGELYRYLQKELGDEAEEVFSDLAQNLCTGIESFRGDSSLRTWIYVVLRNAIYKHRQRRRREPAAVPLKAPGGESSASLQAPRLSGVISVSSLAFDGPSPSSIFRRADERVKLRELMRGLSRSDQQLLEMVLDRGMTHEEIAAELSRVLQKKVTPETIRQRFHRAQERLKKLAEEAGYR